jgi:hypothetical protein
MSDALAKALAYWGSVAFGIWFWWLVMQTLGLWGSAT